MGPFLEPHTDAGETTSVLLAGTHSGADPVSTKPGQAPGCSAFAGCAIAGTACCRFRLEVWAECSQEVEAEERL